MKNIIYIFFFLQAVVMGLDDLKNAKIGECYKKIIIPPKYDIKEELIEVEKSQKKIIVKDAKFKKELKKIITSPAYTKLIPIDATFETKKIKLLVRAKRIYYTLKNSNIELSDNYIEMVKKSGLNIEEMKVGECYSEYIEIQGEEKEQREYEAKQAFEIIDIAPAEFEIIKKKVLIKPAYTKVIKTPPIYETKIIKVLISPEVKEYIEKENGEICVVSKKPKYKTIVKKILKEPAKTKVIQFPATYKEIEVKVMSKPPIISRRVIPAKKKKYTFVKGLSKRYFWSKKELKDKMKTGLSICKKELPPKYKEFTIQTVLTPATIKKEKVDSKYINIEIMKKIEDANSTTIVLPPQYERVKTKVLISPSQIFWEKVDCITQ